MSRRLTGLLLTALVLAGVYLVIQRSRPLAPDPVLVRATALTDAGNYPEAVQAYTARVLASPTDAAAHSGLGNALLLMGRYDASAQAMESALALDADTPHGYCRLADAYVHLRLRKAAVRAIEQAIQRAPDCAHARLVAGEQWLRDDDLTRALEEFRRAIELAPEVSTGHQRAGYVLVELGRHEEAEQVLLQGLKLSPNRPDLHLQLARVYNLRPQDPTSLDKAVRHYRAALQGNPRAEEAMAALGTLASRRGNPEEARGWWSDSLRINRNLSQSLYGLAQLARREGKAGDASLLMRRYEEVQAFLRTVTALRTQTVATDRRDLRLRLVRLSLEAGHLDEAERQLTALAETAPSDPEVRVLLGQLRGEQGRPDLARLEFKLAGLLSQEGGA